MSAAAPAIPKAGPKPITLMINGRTVTVPEMTPVLDQMRPTTVLDAARTAGIIVPALCHKEDLNPVAVCRACVVEIEDNGSGRGERLLAAACTRPVADKMKVNTKSEKAEANRKTLIELLLAEHPHPCGKGKNCELEQLGAQYGITKPLYTPRNFSKGTDYTNFSIAIDHSSCILCDRCVRACSEVAHNFVIGRMGKGMTTSISFDDDQKMGDSSCVNCGWCMISCPTGAITYGGGAQTEVRDERGHKIGTPLSAEDLRHHPLFNRVNVEFLRRSEGAVVVRQFNEGEVICRQGEFGDTAFYIDAGEVDIFIDTPMSHVRTKGDGGLFKRVTSLLLHRESDDRRDQDQRRFVPIDATATDLDFNKPIARIGAGELIGEAACMNHQPRSATVVAAKDGTIVLVMLRNVLDILRRQREFRRTMDRKYRERALDTHLRSVKEFSDLPGEFIDYLRQRVELISYNPGEVICRQGDPADAFYLVRMGHVKVFETFADGQGMVMSYLSRSQYFGEIGLLQGGVRTATCSALDHVEVVRIGKPEFDQMIGRYPEIKKRLQTEAEARLHQNLERASRPGNISLPQFIDQGLYEAQSLLILDLEKCTRCDECVRACAQAHNGVTRLVREGLRFENFLVATSCRSCRDPLCLVGCPVDAIHRKKNLQIIIEDHCIGCENCARQCPYGNINMQPYKVEFTSLLTHEKEVREGKKATVCDLCDDQCLGESQDPSCVYACPHDAAHRVDGQSFFDLRVLGARVAQEKDQAVMGRQ